MIYKLEHKWNCWSGIVTTRVLLSSFLHHWVVVLCEPVRKVEERKPEMSRWWKVANQK